MKRVFLLLVTTFVTGSIVSAQDKYFTKTGSISFFSHTSMEDIEAHNNKATCVVDTKTGAMEFAVLMKGFEFEKALMEEHFNENYVESDTYPKSTFKGKIDNLSAVNFASNGTYNVTVSGNLTIHGVTKAVTSNGQFVVNGGKVTGTSEFTVQIADYNITVPAVVKDNISKTITIKVNVSLDPMQ